MDDVSFQPQDDFGKSIPGKNPPLEGEDAIVVSKEKDPPMLDDDPGQAAMRLAAEESLEKELDRGLSDSDLAAIGAIKPTPIVTRTPTVQPVTTPKPAAIPVTPEKVRDLVPPPDLVPKAAQPSINQFETFARPIPSQSGTEQIKRPTSDLQSAISSFMPHVQMPTVQKQTSVPTPSPAPAIGIHIAPKSPVPAMVPPLAPQKESSSTAQQAAPTHTKSTDPLVAQDPNLKPLRTYESDVAAAMTHRRTSVASIAIAESKAKNKGETLKNTAPSVTGKNLFVLFLSFAIVAAGAMGAYYLYTRSALFTSRSTPVAPQQKQNSIVPSDAFATISADGQNASSLTAKLRAESQKPQNPGTLKEIIVTETQNSSTVRVPASDMASLLSIGAPDILLRTLAPAWMLGIYADTSGHTSAFAIVTTDFFQNAFTGMLQWESSMPESLRPYLYAISPRTNIIIDSPASTTTATSTPSPISQVSLPIYAPIQGHFEDRIIRSKDVRVFKTNDGETLFLYSFIDNSHLIVAGNESALTEILVRLEKKAFVR